MHILSAIQTSSSSENRISNKSNEKASSIHGVAEVYLLFDDSVHQDALRRNTSSSLRDNGDNRPVWVHVRTYLLRQQTHVYTKVSTANNMASTAVQCPFNDIGILLQLEKHDTRKEEPIDCESSDSIIDKKPLSLGCPSHELLCNLSEDNTVPKTK